MSWAALTPDPRVTQALIAGGFVAIGWLVNGRQNRRRDARLRAERVRDVQRALFAEIRAHVALLRHYDLQDDGEETARRIETEPGYFPTLPTQTKDAVFQAIIGEIHVLPRDTIDPIVVYYHQINMIAAIIDDLRDLDPSKTGAARAAEIYRDFVAVKREALDLGEQAMIAIAANSDGTGARVNTPSGASLSGQGSV